MATTYHADLQKLYVAYFNRPADAAGLDYWEGVVEAANGSLAGVSAAFAADKEYTAEYGTLTNAQVITKIYTNLFGHAPDTAGKAYYVDLLDNKKLTIDQIVTEVANGAQGSDKVAYANKVTAAGAFTDALDTTAEKTGYSGADANTAAKAFLAGITTDGSLQAAIAPASLNSTVAAVIKAGVPFTLANGLAALGDSHTALSDFLDSLDLDDNADTDTVATDVTAALGTAATKIAVDVAAIPGTSTYDPDPTTASASVNAAVLADAQAKLEAKLTLDQTNYTKAVAAADKTDGLGDAIASADATAASATAAAKAAVVADSAYAGALASFTTAVVAAGGTVTTNVDGSVKYTDSLAVDHALIDVSSAGKFSLHTGVTETTNPGITALLTTIKADAAAHTTLDTANNAAYAAHLSVAVLDTDADASVEAAALDDLGAAFSVVTPDDVHAPTADEVVAEFIALSTAYDAVKVAGGAPATAALADLNDFKAAVATYEGATTNALSDAVAGAKATVDADIKASSGLDTDIADLQTAQTNATTLAHLQDAITAAQKAFVTNDFKAPVTLDVSSTLAATSGSDIYLAGKSLTNTIANFGLQGDDVLYVGKDFVLNSGALKDGNNAVLEVFLIQSGSNTVVNIETKAFGSNSADAEIKITLTGVSVGDLQFENGIITHV
jgi:hypothetical protein